MPRAKAVASVLLVYAGVHGVLAWLAQRGKLPPLVPSVSVLVLCALSTLWVYIDAKDRGYTVKPWLLIVVFILPIVGVPIYLHRYREEALRRRSIRRFLGAVAAMFVLYLIGTFIADALPSRTSSGFETQR